MAAIQTILKNAIKGVVPKRVRKLLVPEALRTRFGSYQPFNYASSQWEEEYGSDKWTHLEGVGELARYGVISGYHKLLKPAPQILDVGCGTGILMQRFRALGYSKYLGIDVSAEAIHRAQLNQDESTSFVAANVETYKLDGSYDAIIFNEVLYYLKDPKKIFLDYASHLGPKGVLIISMHQSSVSLRVWNLLAGLAPVLDEVRLANVGNRVAWDIKVYAAGR